MWIRPQYSVWIIYTWIHILNICCWVGAGLWSMSIRKCTISCLAHWICGSEFLFLGLLSPGQNQIIIKNWLIHDLIKMILSYIATFFNCWSFMLFLSDFYCVWLLSGSIILWQQKNFECDKCHKKYKLKQGLAQHQKYECGVEPQFQCPHCSYKAKLKGNLKSHILNVHRPSINALLQIKVKKETI